MEACRKLRCRSALIDGEIIVQDNNGISDFAALRKAIDREPDRLVMFAFDLLFLDGADLRREPLWHRREELRQLIRPDPRSALHFNDHYEGDGVVLFKQACVLGLEGIVSKRALSPYKSGPSKFWLKTKNVVESELILLGTDYDNEASRLPILVDLKLAGVTTSVLQGRHISASPVRPGTSYRGLLKSFRPPNLRLNCRGPASRNGLDLNFGCAFVILQVAILCAMRVCKD